MSDRESQARQHHREQWVKSGWVGLSEHWSGISVGVVLHAVPDADGPPPDEAANADADALARLRAIEVLGERWKRGPRRNDRINQHLSGALTSVGLTSGDVLEIGAREHPRTDVFSPPNWRYSVLDIEDGSSTVPVLVGDITNCPEFEDESFDVIVSVDVFEHVNRPWLAAEEIQRLLRPGGLSYTSTLFAWRFHPVPIDYWRFTPDCLDFLFGGLERVDSGFDTTERRRDIRGRGKRDQVPVDELGGFRENWRVYHIGRKR